jgi:hypothetical protein
LPAAAIAEGFVTLGGRLQLIGPHPDIPARRTVLDLDRDGGLRKAGLGGITKLQFSRLRQNLFTYPEIRELGMGYNSGQFLARFTNKFSRKWGMYLMAMLGAAQ